MTATCQWCKKEIPYAHPDIFTIITGTNHQVFHFCNKQHAYDWLKEICK